MRKLSLVCAAAFLAVSLTFSVAHAASSKATAVAGDMIQIGVKSNWTTVMQNDIKVAHKKDLFIGVSMEVGLTTNTKVMSKFLERAISEAEARVKVRVLIDDGAVAVAPGKDSGKDGVTFARRAQTLIAEFAGALAYEKDGELVNCMEVQVEDGDATGAIVIDEDCVQPEMLALIVDTMAAHTFNFIAKDVPVGMHTIKVQALVDYTPAKDSFIDDLEELELIGSPATNAYLGHGSVTVEEVRMIKDEDITPPEI